MNAEILTWCLIHSFAGGIFLVEFGISFLHVRMVD